jgi:hypothetical protein
MSASADVLAQAKVEIDLAAIPEGKNVRSNRSHYIPQQVPELTKPGHYQVARQARLHPSPHRRRNQGGRRHQVGSPARPAVRWRPCSEARMAHHAGCLHALGMRTHWRGRRLWRLVLPMPRLSLRHLRPHKKGTGAIELGDSCVRLPRGGQGCHWLEGDVCVRAWEAEGLCQ